MYTTQLESLVPVEIIAIENQEKPSQVTIGDVLHRLCLYRMHGTPLLPPVLPEGPDGAGGDDGYEDPEIESAEVFDLPHHDFDGNWEE